MLGRHLEVYAISPGGKRTALAQAEMYSRQILAFGEKGQWILSSLKIGIVGVGGTGSCVAEQLARLGIIDFILIDKDNLDLSNLTRVHGSTLKQVRSSKVSITKANIKRIQPKAKVEKIHNDVLRQDVLSLLKDCDIVFSCTDRHAPRSVLNELCYQYFIPVIDVGVGLDSDGSNIVGGSIRATLIGPELPCLFCYGIVRPDIISAELMSPQERQQRQREGYIRNLQDTSASVVSFTTTAAGMGVSLFLDLLFGYMRSEMSNHLILDVASFDSHRLSVTPKDCVCLTRLGRGDFMPLSAP